MTIKAYPERYVKSDSVRYDTYQILRDDWVERGYNHYTLELSGAEYVILKDIMFNMIEKKCLSGVPGFEILSLEPVDFLVQVPFTNPRTQLFIN